MRVSRCLFTISLFPLCLFAFAAAQNVSTWRVVWVGGQSNSVGTNSDTKEHPSWPLNPRIQAFSGWRRPPGSFVPAAYPVYNEANVGFSLTFANLLLQTLPPNEGVIIVNT